MTDSPASASKARIRRGILRTVLALAGFYILVCGVVCAFQRRLIYFPTRFNPKLAEIMAERAGFIPWKNSLNRIIGWKLPAKTSPAGSVLVVHGNAGCAIDRDYFAKPIREAASVDVYILEYPGYGAREGSPSEKNFLAAAEEAFALLETNRPIYVVSESIGAGVAAHLAKTQGSKVAGLAMFVPYNNFAQLAQTKISFLPVSLILLDRYNPEKWLKEYRGPIEFVLAEKDQVIPLKFGQRLVDSYTGPKNLEIVKAAGHNSVSTQSPAWWNDVFSFWEKNGKRN